MQDAGYEITYKQGSNKITIYLPPQNPNIPSEFSSSIEELAKKEIENYAGSEGLDLPDGFEEDILIVPYIQKD